jgi:hypothetical protein
LRPTECFDLLMIQAYDWIIGTSCVGFAWNIVTEEQRRWSGNLLDRRCLESHNWSRNCLAIIKLEGSYPHTQNLLQTCEF